MTPAAYSAEESPSMPIHAAALITAAGSSNRFNSTQTQQTTGKKEFFLLGGHAVIYHTALPFFVLPEIRTIIITTIKGAEQETLSLLQDLPSRYGKELIIIAGGNTRQESVHLGLNCLHTLQTPPEFVCIHDGARPWVNKDLILATLSAAVVQGGAAPVIKHTDAVKHIDAQGFITQHLDRNFIVSIQTPQTFRFPDILEAHDKAASTDKFYVDDTEIFTDFGGIVAGVPGDPANRKITFREDLVQPSYTKD